MLSNFICVFLFSLISNMIFGIGWKHIMVTPFWGVTLYYFSRICMFECILPQTFERFSQYFCILCYNIT
jgi:hypothetical protein